MAGMTLAVVAAKGGTGKTTTAAALAHAAAKDRRRVLAVDLDPQQNLTAILGADPEAFGAFEIFQGMTAAEAVQAVEGGLHVIAANPNLSTITSGYKSAYRLAEALKPIEQDYDTIIIDTAPATTEMLFNAVLASDAVLIPVKADSLSIGALPITARVVRALKPDTKLAACVCDFQGGAKVQAFNLSEAARLSEKLEITFTGMIRHSAAAVGGSSNLGISIYDYAPKSKTAQDYQRLYDKLKGAFI